MEPSYLRVCFSKDNPRSFVGLSVFLKGLPLIQRLTRFKNKFQLQFIQTNSTSRVLDELTQFGNTRPKPIMAVHGSNAVPSLTGSVSIGELLNSCWPQVSDLKGDDNVCFHPLCIWVWEAEERLCGNELNEL